MSFIDKIKIENTVYEIKDENARSKISSLESKTNSLASGSPLSASSIEKMTDTSRIYVNTTDGHWYYYNENTWVDGGVYQSTEIEEKTVTYNKLESELQDSFSRETRLTTYKPEINTFITNGLNKTTINQFFLYTIPVTPGETYYLDCNSWDSNYGNADGVILLVGNNTLIKSITKSEIEFKQYDSQICRMYASVDIPYGVDTLYINTNGLNSSIQKVNKYVVEGIHKHQLDDKLQNIFTDIYEEVTPNLFVDNAYLDKNDTIQSLNNYQIYQYDVQPKEKYKITVKQIYGNPIVLFATHNGEKSYTINDVAHTVNVHIDEIKSDTSEYSFVDYEFEIPSYCTKIYINVNTNKQLILKKSTTYKILVDSVDVEKVKDSINPLSNKSIMFVGDSICAAATPGVKGWATLISENNPLATIYNYGRDGATIAQNGRDDNDVYTKIQTMFAEHPNADYIIIQGGVNDIWQSIPLGEFEKNANYDGYTPYDTTTFSGALEWVFHYCLVNFPGKKIGYIVTHKVHASGEFWTFMDRAKEICEKWCIPYIDLYNESNLNLYISEHRQAYSITNRIATGDGCHPNLDGYKIITPKIENWLKTL